MSWLPPQLMREPVLLGRVGPLGLLPYAIPCSARSTHLYVIGSTGSGKSKFLEGMIVADILANRGVGLVDPHSDLARDIRAHLAAKGFFDNPDNVDRFMYFDPTQVEGFIAFNVLNVPGFEPYAIAQGIIEAFRRTWPQALAEAPRFTNIATAALLVLITSGKTLVDMPTLLTNKGYREELLRQVEDPAIVEYFHSRFDQWGRDTAMMLESVLNKVTAFSLNPHLRRLLGSQENRLNFREIMDQGKTLIVDLGNCDGETRRLIGSLVVTGVEQAALSRKEASTRRPFYFFMDEFQDFCANEGAVKTLAQILSECRKFGLYLHLAHQTLGQLQQRLISALGNVGIKIVFTIDREDAEVMAKKLFSVDTEEVKHEPQTETQHPVYSPLNEQWEQWTARLQSLRPRYAWVKQRSKNPVQITTQSVPDFAGSHHTPTEMPVCSVRIERDYPFTNSSNPSPTRPLPMSDWEQSKEHVLYQAPAT